MASHAARNWRETLHLFSRHWFTLVLIVAMVCAQTYLSESLNQELNLFLEELNAESVVASRSGYVRTYQREIPNPDGSFLGGLRNMGLRIINRQLDAQASFTLPGAGGSEAPEAFRTPSGSENSGKDGWDGRRGQYSGHPEDSTRNGASHSVGHGEKPGNGILVEDGGFEEYVAAHPYYSAETIQMARDSALRGPHGSSRKPRLWGLLPFSRSRASHGDADDPQGLGLRRPSVPDGTSSLTLSPARQDSCGLELYILHLVELLVVKTLAMAGARLLSIVVRISISQMQKLQRSRMRVGFASAMLEKSLQQPMSAIDSGRVDAIHIWEDSFDLSVLVGTLVNNFVPPLFTLASSFLLKSAVRRSGASAASSLVGSFSFSDWVVVLLALAPLPFQIHIVLNSESRSRAKMSSTQRRRAAVGNQLTDTLSKTKLIKLYCTQEHEIRLLAAKIDSHSNLVSEKMLLHERRQLSETCIRIFTHNLMLWYGFVNTSTGTFGLVHAKRLTSFVNMIYDQVKHLASSYSSFGEFYVTLLSIAEALGIPQEPEIRATRESVVYLSERRRAAADAAMERAIVSAVSAASTASTASAAASDAAAGGSRAGGASACPRSIVRKLKALLCPKRSSRPSAVSIKVLRPAASTAEPSGALAGELDLADLSPMFASSSPERSEPAPVDLDTYTKILTGRLGITRVYDAGEHAQPLPASRVSSRRLAPRASQALKALKAIVSRAFSTTSLLPPGLRETWLHQRRGDPELIFPPVEIRFEGVSFVYPARPDKQVLGGFSLSIPAGTKIAIVGKTGAGKSTISQLLTRLYEPDSGTIYFNGVPLNLVPLSLVRQLVTVLLQDNTVVAGTGLENIFYGSPLFQKLVRLLPKPPEEDEVEVARKQRLRARARKEKKQKGEKSSGDGDRPRGTSPGSSAEAVAEPAGEAKADVSAEGTELAVSFPAESPAGSAPASRPASPTAPPARRAAGPSESALSSNSSSTASLLGHRHFGNLSLSWEESLQSRPVAEDLARAGVNRAGELAESAESSSDSSSDAEVDAAGGVEGTDLSSGAGSGPEGEPAPKPLAESHPLLWSRRSSAARAARQREKDEQLADLKERGAEIAGLVCADGFLREYGYDTRLNPLSGGQRQRLCLGRAIARGGSVIILDEATSALDENTEARVTANLFEHFDSSQTVIIIAHRLSTIRAADKIVVLGRPDVDELEALGGRLSSSSQGQARPQPARASFVTASQGDFSVGSRVLEMGSYQELMDHGKHFLDLCKSLQEDGQSG